MPDYDPRAAPTWAPGDALPDKKTQREAFDRITHYNRLAEKRKKEAGNDLENLPREAEES